MKIIRFKCPSCGLMAEWWNEKYPERSLKNKPEHGELRIFEQTFGGSRSLGIPKGKKYLRMKDYPAGSTKKIKGIINYRDITDENKELYNEIKKFLVQRSKQLKI